MADVVAGDTKAGTLIAKDRFGNKYYENLEEELPRKLRIYAPSEGQKLTGCSTHKMGGL